METAEAVATGVQRRVDQQQHDRADGMRIIYLDLTYRSTVVCLLFEDRHPRAVRLDVSTPIIRLRCLSKQGGAPAVPPAAVGAVDSGDGSLCNASARRLPHGPSATHRSSSRHHSLLH